MNRILRGREIKKRKKISALKNFLILAAIVLIIIIILTSPLFDVAIIEVVGNNKITTQDIVNAGIIENINIFSISSSKSKNYLLQDPYVKSVNISKIYPDKIVVNIQERKARAYIEYENMESYIIVDETGTVLGTQNTITDVNLPIIVGISFTNLKIGYPLLVNSEEAFETVVTLSKAFENNNITNVDKVDISNLTDIHIYSGLIDVLVGDISNIDEKLLYFKASLETGLVDGFRGTFDIRNPEKQYGWFSISR